MTGLESIINQIAGDAQQEASEILAGAKERAEKAAKEAQEEAKRQADAILQKGEQDAKDIRERAQSAAELEKRNQMLSFKQSLIGEAIEGTRASLEEAPDKEYFDTLLQLYKRFAQKGQGELRLNQKDLKRLPGDFLARLEQAVPEADMHISPAPADIESGFLLVYGGMDINCTFRAVFEDAADALRDAAGRLLFPA